MTFDGASSAALPRDWPAEVALPPGFVVSSGTCHGLGATTSCSVSGVAPRVREVLAFYADQRGWTSTGGRRFAGPRGDTLTVTPDLATSTVTLDWSRSAP